METEKKDRTNVGVPRPRLRRARQRAAALRTQRQRLEARAHEERRRHASVDTTFEIVERDGETGGGIIAGALAYRLFIWLLPLALVAIAGLGLAAEAASTSPEEAAGSIGMAGLVSHSIASSSKSSARWYALLVGIPVLVYTTRSLLRALIGAHRLVWTDARTAAPKPTLAATLRFLGLLIGIYVVTALAGAVRVRPGGVAGVLVTLFMAVPYGGLWLLVMATLPHRTAAWTALVPGALLFGLAVEVIHVVTTYVIAPYAIAKEGTYGALGVAAALLVGLYLISRLIVLAAVLNATLWERRTRTE